MTMIKDLVNWYLKYFTKCNCKLFLSAFNNPAYEKALVLLVGNSKLKRDCHPYYLWRFRKNWPYRDKLLKRIRTSAIWNGPFTHLTNFEDLYADVWNKLNNPRIPYISQLVIYDIARYLACIEGSGCLMPKDFVYIHALPLKALYVMKNNGFLSNLKITNGKISVSDLSPYFHSLSAEEIEDLFCQLGKSLRRVGKGKTSAKAEERAIDAIVSKHIKNFKPIIP